MKILKSPILSVDAGKLMRELWMQHDCLTLVRKQLHDIIFIAFVSKRIKTLRESQCAVLKLITYSKMAR